MENNNMLEQIVQELQNRIGQMTAEYETKLAVMKAQATQEIQQRDTVIQELNKQLADKDKED